MDEGCLSMATTIAMDSSSSSSSSLHPPPEVPKKLHLENREKLIKHLRESLDSSSRPLRGFVLLQVKYLHRFEFEFILEDFFNRNSLVLLGRRGANSLLH